MDRNSQSWVFKDLDELQKWFNRSTGQDDDQRERPYAGNALVVPWSDWIEQAMSKPQTDSAVTTWSDPTALQSRLELLSPAGSDTGGTGKADQATSHQPSHGHRSVSNSSNSDRNSSSRGASSARSTSYAHARPGHALHAASGRIQATSSNPRTSSVGSGSSSNAAAGIQNARGPDTQDGLAALANNIGRFSSELFASNIAAELREIGVCSQHCQCAGFTSSKLQHLQSVLAEGDRFFKPPAATSEQSLVSKLECRFLPALAAKLFDPAGKHKLVALQEALSEFHKRVVLPATSMETMGKRSSASPLLLASKERALSVGIAVSKSGLCGHLCWHLDTLCCKLAEQKLQRGHAEGLDPLLSGCQQAATAGQPAGSNSTPAGDLEAASSSLHQQLSTTQHLLAQLLLVYQWTAALCRIWPSSIPDAKGLTSLLSSALAGAGLLVTQLPLMQSPSSAHSTVSEALQHSAASAASSGRCAAKDTQHLAQLAGPIMAAVLEVAGMVLEPLGLLLQQQQVAEQQGVQPPSLSASAKALCSDLRGSTFVLLQAVLTVCLHQLVLHAEHKHGVSTQLCAGNSMQQGAPCSTAADCGLAPGSSNISSSIAELAEGYLLQHADTLQAKQPAAPSRAAVLAWRAVCERQWADLSLPLTLQDTAAVLASMQPVATTTSPGGGCDAGSAAAKVWAMQDCGALHGHFDGLSQTGDASGLGGPSSCKASTSTAMQASTSTPEPSGSTGTGDTSTSISDCLGSARDLPVFQGAHPILSIASCTHKATALSAVCWHVVKTAGTSNSSSTCSLVCTLLATAAAAVSLQGATALPMVSAAVAAASALIKDKPPAQQPADLSTAERQAGSAAASVSNAPESHMEPHAAAATAVSAAAGMSAAAHSGAAAAPDGSELLRCLSLAGDLTAAVLQLGGEPQAVQPTFPATQVSFQCAQLLTALLAHMAVQSKDTAEATPPRLLQSVAYTLQLVEAAVRRHAVSLTAQRKAVVEGGLQPNLLSSQRHKGCPDIACDAAGAAMNLTSVCKASPAVLGSLQGQLLLQSCTSLLLTYSSMLVADYTASPRSLQLCALLLRRIQQSDFEGQAAAGGSSCGISQSLTAGLSLVGRCFKLLSLQIQVNPPDAGDSSSSSSTSSSSSASSPEQQGRKLRAYFRDWLSLTTGKALQPGGQIDSKLSEDLRSQADILQWGVHQTEALVGHISRTLQQECARYVISSPSDGNTSSTSDSQQGRQHDTASSAGHASQHCRGTQQQQPPADWLVGGLHTAHSALQEVLLPLDAALAPYLAGVDPLSTPVNLHALPLPILLAAAGEALCAAVPSSACCSSPCCSSPCCTNLAGVSAGFALVRGKGCVCGGCLGLQAGGSAAAPRQGALIAARYCSRACQAAHRQQHQGLCRKLAQEAAAAPHDP